MATTGKNELCYCGSGLAYRECCLVSDIAAVQGGAVANVLEDFTVSTDEKVFSLEEDASGTIDRFTAGATTPVYEFCGLTSEEMHRLLYSPFDSRGLVKFNLDMRNFPDSPFFRLFFFIMRGASGNGLRMTAKGNLPRHFVREAVGRIYGEQESARYGSIQSETDFVPLHVVRLIAELSGMLQKGKSGFRATGTGNAVAHGGLNGQFFLELFKVYAVKFNWAYCDRYPELHVIQASFLFMLYALAKYGETFRPASFYEDLFLSAFPLAVHDVDGSAYETPEQAVKRCFSLRMLSRFALFFGFIELKRPRTDRRGGLGELRKTPFLDEWIQFHEK